MELNACVTKIEYGCTFLKWFVNTSGNSLTRFFIFSVNWDTLDKCCNSRRNVLPSSSSEILQSSGKHVSEHVKF